MCLINSKEVDPMKKFKLLGLLVGTLALGGCMATISPDGTVSAGYLVPEVNSVVITSRPSRPIRVARNTGHRPPRSARNHYNSHGGHRPR